MSGRQIYIYIRQKLEHFLNPALCLTCGVPVTVGSYLCPSCLAALERVPDPCQCCGLPNHSTQPLCANCLLHPPRWHSMIAPLVYSGNTRRMIQDLKFNEQLHHANALLSHIQTDYSNHKVDVLIPVPLHTTRLLERGYNQAEEIASTLSRLLHIPVDRHSLKRVKATESQSGLSIHKRQKNILKAFQYLPQQHYQSVAIIDDIITTGSTAAEICKVLIRAEVKHIEIWGIARALKDE